MSITIFGQIQNQLDVARRRISELKQERDELVAQVEVMRNLLQRVDDGIRSTDLMLAGVDQEITDVLTISPHAALREIEANALEELLTKFEWFSSEDGLWLADAIAAMSEEKRTK